MNATAKPVPAFLKQSIIYQLFLRAFTPGGTLASAEKMLPHLAECGVDIVYLCPIALSDDDPRVEFFSDRQIKSGLGNPQNPYRLKDYAQIDPEYGTDADLRAFVRTAHHLGLKVMLDLVYLHCGPCATVISLDPEYVRRDAQGNVANGPWHFPLLNFESRKLREYLIQNMEYFIRAFDVDGYRCDVGDGCPLDFWEEAQTRVAALKPDFVMLNEGVKPEYLQKAFDINYDFGWAGQLRDIFAQTRPASDLAAYWQKIHDAYPQGGRVIRSIDNHDIANDSYDLRIEAQLGGRAVEAALLINDTIDGVPFLYNGYEVADTTRHSIYANRFYGKNLCIDWSNALAPQGVRRRKFIRALADLRHQFAVLGAGEVRWLTTDRPAAILCFERGQVNEAERLLVLVNASDAPQTVRVPEGAPWESLMAEGVCTQSDADSFIANVLPFGFLVARLY